MAQVRMWVGRSGASSVIERHMSGDQMAFINGESETPYEKGKLLNARIHTRFSPYTAVNRGDGCRLNITHDGKEERLDMRLHLGPGMEGPGWSKSP